MKKRPIIAIVSPALNVYSETFIEAQKKGLKAEVFYYYGGFLPLYLENYGRLIDYSVSFITKVKRKLGFKIKNIEEKAFIYSLKKNNIQLVLAQYGPTAQRIVKICKEFNIPLITHFHGYDASVHEVIKKNNNYKTVFDYSSSVIAVSREMQKSLVSLGCTKEKVIYNPCVPSTEFLEIKPQFSESVFIGLGRFVDKKAPYYTILAFQKVLDQFPNAYLVMGGNGELFEVCKNLVQHLKIENNVLLTGVLTKEKFISYLSNALAFVQHSVTALDGDQEGTPVAIMEASAAGLPVISTFHAGIPDVILNNETGFLVAEHDVDTMAEKMLYLLENKIEAMQMGMKGKERIASHFTLEKHLRTLDELIDKTISNNV